MKIAERANNSLIEEAKIISKLTQKICFIPTKCIFYYYYNDVKTINTFKLN